MSGQQNHDVLAWLRKWPSITQMEAISGLSCLRLSARIHELRNAGHVIEREMIEVQRRDGSKARVARYRLIQEAKAAA